MVWIFALAAVAVLFYFVGKSTWMRLESLRTDIRERCSALSLGLLSVNKIVKRVAWGDENQSERDRALELLASAQDVCDRIDLQTLAEVADEQLLVSFKTDLDEALLNVHRARVLVEPFDPETAAEDEDLWNVQGQAGDNNKS